MRETKMDAAKARRIRRPSERNLRVFEQVRQLGRTQAEVAAEYGISQERVSQICRQIDRWWARTHAEPGRDRRRAELLLARRRFERIFTHAARELAKENIALVTQRTVWRAGDQARREETTRTQPQSPQWGKIVLATSRHLARLDAQLGPDDAARPGPPPLGAREAAEVLKYYRSSCVPGQSALAGTTADESLSDANRGLPIVCDEIARSDNAPDGSPARREISQDVLRVLTAAGGRPRAEPAP